MTSLNDVVAETRARIRSIRERGTNIGEQNTKATLIDPVLAALGWDLHNVDEVFREYRRKSQDNPVDYALFLLRSPRLFIEAKALDLDLNDRKWISQTLGYATVVGVEWCVLTNGDEYRLYNSHAAVDVEEKVFRVTRISDEDQSQFAVDTLDLLSKDKLGENLLSILWKAHFVDRRVGAVLTEMFQDTDPGLIRLVQKRLADLRPPEIRDSLKRADARFTFPSALPTVGPRKRKLVEKLEQTTVARGPDKAQVDGPAFFGVSIQDLIGAGLITPPLELHRLYKDVVLTAKVLETGKIHFDGELYDSVSTAAGMARKSVVGAPPGRSYPQTNGWTFWQYWNSSSGTYCELDQIRQAFLAQKQKP